MALTGNELPSARGEDGAAPVPAGRQGRAEQKTLPAAIRALVDILPSGGGTVSLHLPRAEDCADPLSHSTPMMKAESSCFPLLCPTVF